MSDMRFTKDHEWIRIDGDTGTVGITAYASQQLGDVVFVELPDVGKTLEQGHEAAVVESVKAASEVYAPAGGEVIAINRAILDKPGLVNEGPESEGWFLKLRVTDKGDLDSLMTKAAYDEYIKGLA